MHKKQNFGTKSIKYRIWIFSFYLPLYESLLAHLAEGAFSDTAAHVLVMLIGVD